MEGLGSSDLQRPVFRAPQTVVLGRTSLRPGNAARKGNEQSSAATLHNQILPMFFIVVKTAIS
ncbi:MAG: hypothetical protein A2418_02265 [Candidatus Brennerbacteria bacterium RIFOXYC1_FULL_41_11]|uniref:Uncharacterized protein n=1 Tax=Candidatus Brennerbacteria bacterium RIFOXYD1_FULL_41_16 TaxID=1797529 RepID=A0A1G1XJN1_9BACT|nr:MAG: hypothetical protein A2391_02015 [Candidatus Brennerbacteria bacterium RIFOXYB1_FULL_41_13]OGY39008.1 MAG: hypothetical protein A2418_02265 [Candidatus Brennerbacteria bacterium RIFOXYC1_FULL_41_11]OGY40161.1 MAG: hypothetical protein A2570_02645 [Candidatus Brennerbacteria bacterium RIFOXYD1_FULL_41_16]